MASNLGFLHTKKALKSPRVSTMLDSPVTLLSSCSITRLEAPIPKLKT